MLKKEKFRQQKDLNYGLSIHSKLSYFLTTLTILIQFYLGFTHISDTDPTGRYFSTFCLIEGMFAIGGLFLPDLIRGYRLGLYPKDRFKRISTITIFVFIVSLVLNMLIQAIIKVPLTIRDIEMALAIVFAAPAEEMFFRAIFIETFSKTSEKLDLGSIVISKKKNRKIGHLEIVGLFVSSIAFALLHVNYYDDIRLMSIVFLGGLIYAVFYWNYRDITGCILAHFALNIIAVFQTFFLFSL
jgi:membrane protease YdiL (CAAX protease family)